MNHHAQPRASARTAVLALAVLLGPALAGPTALAGPGTRDYQVRDGETCLEIAVRELGDRKAVKQLHKLNPQLGPLPHNLIAGQVLKLPGRIAATADAQLTDKRGTVQIRRAGEGDWLGATTGANLWRAWRVGSRARATAEVTFADKSRIAMRENTVVIIFGPGKGSQSARASATLEQGTLRSRLSELDGKGLTIDTASAQAVVGPGEALVSVDAAEVTRVATHSGRGSTVKGRGKKRKSVKVAAGFGSRVEKGKDPTPPAPLPPAPTWTSSPALVLDTTGTGATIQASWTAVPGAVAYDVDIAADAEMRDIVQHLTLGSNVTSLEAQAVPPGDYTIEVVARDAAGFESVRGELRPVRVAALPLPTVAPGTTTLALGSSFDAPPELGCGLGDAPPRARVTFTTPGRQQIRCVGATGAVATIEVEVGAITVSQVASGAVVPGGEATFDVQVGGAVPADASFVVTPPLAANGQALLQVGKVTRTATGVSLTVVVPAATPDGQYNLRVALAGADGAPGVELGVATVDVRAPIAPPSPVPPAPVNRTLHSRVGVAGGVVSGRDGAGGDGTAGAAGLVAQVEAAPWLALDIGLTRAARADADTVGSVGVDLALPGRVRPMARGGLTVRAAAHPGGYLGAGVAVDLSRHLTLQATVDVAADGDGAHDGRRITGLAGLLWSVP